jgi:hypothetical protein
MTTTTLSGHVDRMHTLMDQQAQTHTLELSNDTLLLDGRPALLTISSTDVQFQTETGVTCVTAQAFWYAFAGAEPTATEAGQLLADSLVRMQVLQQMQRLQDIFQGVYTHIQKLGEIPLPSYRLDPFVQQALDAFDGRPETTRLLARILKQDEAVIAAWASSLGKEPITVAELPKNAQDADTQNGHHPDIQCISAPAALQSEQPSVSCLEQEASQRLQWTAAMDAQLTTTFEASRQSSLKETVTEISKRFGWPENSVRGRIYKLRLNEKKRSAAMPHHREPESSREDD